MSDSSTQTPQRRGTDQMSLQFTCSVGGANSIYYGEAQDGQRPFLRFSVVHNRYAGKDAEGNVRINATWFDVVVFGDQATNLKKVLEPGYRLSLKGRIEDNTARPDHVVIQAGERKGEVITRPRKQVVPDLVEGVTLLGPSLASQQRRAQADSQTEAPDAPSAVTEAAPEAQPEPAPAPEGAAA